MCACVGELAWVKAGREGERERGREGGGQVILLVRERDDHPLQPHSQTLHLFPDMVHMHALPYGGKLWRGF